MAGTMKQNKRFAGLSPVLPALREEEREEEREGEALSGMERLRAAKAEVSGGHLSTASEAGGAPSSVGEGGTFPQGKAGTELSGMERLRAAKAAASAPHQSSAATASPRGSQSAAAGTPTGTREAETRTARELETELDTLGKRITGLEAKNKLLAAPLQKAKGELDKRAGNVDAMGKKLTQLYEAANNEALPANTRMSALKSYQALLPSWEREGITYTRAAEGYNRVLPTVQAGEQEYRSLLEQYERTLEEYDLARSQGNSRAEELEKEADALIAQSRALESRARGLAEESDEYYAMRPSLVKPGEMDWTPEQIGEYQRQGETRVEESRRIAQQAQAATAQAREKLREADEERKRYSAWEYQQLMGDYETLTRNPDWAEKSQADPGMMEQHPSTYGLFGAHSDLGYKDEDYAIINGSREALLQYTGDTAEALGALDKAYLTRLSEEEREKYNYLYATKGKDAAQAFIEKLTPALNARQREENAAWWKDYAARKWGGASAFSVLVSPAKMIGTVLQVGDYLEDGKIDPNAAYNKASQISGDIREQVSEMAEKNFGKAGSAAYGLAMSMADFVYNALLTGGFLGGEGEAGKLTLKGLAKGMTKGSIVLMGAEAAADGVLSNLGRGMDDTRALVLGLASGLIEGLTENISLETLLDADLLTDQLWKYIAKNMGAEGSEELSADILNWTLDALYDLLTGQNKSEYKQAIRQNVKDGMSSRDAAKAALRSMFDQAAMDTLGGTVSGGIMAEAGAGINMAGARIAQTGAAKELGASYRNIYRDLIREGLKLPEGSEGRTYAEALADKLARGRKVTDADLGRLALANERSFGNGQTVGNLEAEEDLSAAARAVSTEGEAETGAPSSVGSTDTFPQGKAGTELSGMERLRAAKAAADGGKLSTAAAGTEAPSSVGEGDTFPERMAETGDHLSTAGGPTPLTGKEKQELRTEERNEPRTNAADIGGPGAELLDGDRGREPGERTGAQTGRVGAEPEDWRDLSQPKKAAARQNRGRGIRTEKVSGRDLGIRGASEEKTVTVYPERDWDEELRDINAASVKATGRPVTFVLGSIPVPGTASGKVRGVNVGGRIILQADNLKASATQLFMHEMYHTWAREDPGLTERVKRKITETYSREEFEAIVDKYLEKKAGALDLSRLDEEAMERLTDKCVEEVCADAYAGINWFGGNAGKYRAEAAAAVRESMGGSRETAAATERRTGPPEDYSEEEREEEYMAAVEAGDMETAQRLVDEAAMSYVDNDGEGPVHYYHSARDKQNVFTGHNNGRRTQAVNADDELVEFSKVGFFFNEDKQKNTELYGKNGRYQYDVYLIFNEPYYMNYGDIYRIANKYGDGWGATFRNELVSDGHDAIVIDDGYGTTEVAVFNPEQIKDAAPVTYDDEGNVIPLSERFNPEEADIRFSEDEEAEYTAEDIPALKEEYREISDTAHRVRLKELDREKWMDNEARRKELRRIIARLGTVEPNLNAAREDLEQRERLEYQQELLAQGGIKALRENEKKIKELRKKIGKLEKMAGAAEGTGEPSSVGSADSFPEGKAETEIPQSAAEYAQRKKAGTLPEAERIRALEQEIAARKDPARQAQLLYEKGAEAVAREVREVQQLQAELRELRRPKLPGAQRAQTDNEAIPQSAAEYARRKAEGTLPRSLSEETKARIKEIKQDLKERDTQERKDAIYREKGAEALAAEVNAIKRLQNELNRLEQGDRSKPAPTKNQAYLAKRELGNTLLGLFSIPNYARGEARAIIEHYAEIYRKTGDLGYMDNIALFNKLWELGEVTYRGNNESAREVYSFLRNGKIRVNQGIKADFGDDWNDFRKRAFKLGIFLTNNQADRGWDSLNQELAEVFPGLFDADETDPRTVLERLVQLAEEGQGEKLTLAEYAAVVAGQGFDDEDDLRMNLSRQLDNALRVYASSANIETYLRKKAGETLAKEKDAAQQRQEKAVQRERERGERRVREAEAKGMARLEAARTREALRRGKEKEARRAAEQRKKELTVLKETQQKTLQQLQWLSRNQNKFPEEARARVKEILEDIDIYAISAADEMHIDNATGRTWRDLADTYKEAREKDPNWLPSADLERIVARLDNKKIGQMDIDALRTLYQAAVQLRTELYNRNNLINDMLHREFAEVYSQVKQELENAPEPKTGAAQKYADWQLTPMNRFLQMAGWDKESQWYQMGQMLEQGERDERRFKTRAQNLVGQFLRDNQDWVRRADGQGKDAIWYEIEVPELLELGMGDKPIFGGSKKVWMTPAQKVELYLESKGYDNLRHMTGGRTFPDKELYSKGERKAALEKGTTIRLAPESVKNIVKDLTPEEMDLANLLEQFYNQFSKAEINRVSNLLYGYDKAMEAYYAPIFTNDNYTKSEPGVFDLTAEGVGNLKERQVSSVPSLNLSAFDAFERSVDKTAKFVGLAIPIRNMNTLWNWVGEKTSMKAIVGEKWPVVGKNFVEDLMTELQNGRNAQNGKLDELVNKALNKYISSVFAANVSVVLKQFASYPLAASYLGWENLTLRPRKAAQVDTDLISAYTGELDYRLLGYATPETAALINNPGILQRRGPLNFLFGGGAITWMDGFTVRTLWTAAENKVSREQPDLERGTEEQIRAGQSEFYKAVAKEFNEAVSRSQPMYDTMHRSDTLRKQGALTRAFTLFKTVPQQEFNMLMESFGEVQAAVRSGNAERIKAAKAKMGRTVSGILVGNLMIGAITFLNALWKNKGKKYRDEEGNLTVWSILEQFGKQFFADTMSLGLLGDLVADQIAAVFWDDKLYDIESPGLEQVNDIYQRITAATKNAWQLAKDSVYVMTHGGNWLKYLNMHGDEYVSAVEDVARMLGTYGAGLPMDNVKGYLLGPMRWASPKIATAYEDIMSKADRSGLKGLSGGALELRMEHILRDRIGRAEEETVRVLSRLYEAGVKDAAPPDMPSKVTVDGEERKLNLVQEQTYASAYQLTVGGSLNELVRSAGFRDADAETRGKMLKALYDYGREEAKAAVWPDYEPDNAKAKSFLEAGMTLAQWAAYKAETAGAKKEDILDYIDGMDLTRAQKDAVYYAQGYAESKIDEAPWHRGGKRGSGSTWAKADQSWLMLPAMPQARRSSGPVLPEA